MKIILSLGSNIGERKAQIFAAIELVESYFQTKAVISRFYHSPPYGPQNQDYFYNVAVEIDTVKNYTPIEVLEICQSIEKKIGRVRRYHWGPREIDIDIIFIDAINHKDERLEIPHKEFRKRSFVLRPIMDLPSFSFYQKTFKIIDLDNHDATPLNS